MDRPVDGFFWPTGLLTGKYISSPPTGSLSPLSNSPHGRKPAPINCNYLFQSAFVIRTAVGTTRKTAYFGSAGSRKCVDLQNCSAPNVFRVTESRKLLIWTRVCCPKKPLCGCSHIFICLFPKRHGVSRYQAQHYTRANDPICGRQRQGRADRS